MYMRVNNMNYIFWKLLKKSGIIKELPFWSGIEQNINDGIITTKQHDNFSSVLCRKEISRWNAIPISYAKEGIECLQSNWHVIEHAGLINSLCASHTKQLWSSNIFWDIGELHMAIYIWQCFNTAISVFTTMYSEWNIQTEDHVSNIPSRQFSWKYPQMKDDHTILLSEHPQPTQQIISHTQDQQDKLIF